MAKPKLSLQNLSFLEKAQKANDIVSAMSGNANYATPTPPLATVTTKSDALSAAFSAREDAKSTLDEKQAALKTADAALSDTLSALMAYVESASGGDEEKILSAGFDVRGLPAPPTPMLQVENLDLTIGDMAGRAIARWKAARSAKSYEVQISADPITSTSWTNAGISTKASFTLDGLPSGSRIWVRVRAIGSSGPGPWSDLATKIVP